MSSRALGVSGLAGLLLAIFAFLALPVHAAPGDLDTTFDNDGILLTSLGSSDETWNDSAIQPDGKAVLVGYCMGDSGRNFCIVRLNDDGSFDEDFDGDSGTGNGLVEVGIGTSSSYATGVALQPDGKIIVAGYCMGDGLDFCVVRLETDGTLDTTFGAAGKQIIGASGDNDISPAVVLQPDGKIVLSGQCGGSPDTDFCVVRLLASGSMDTDFGTDGLTRVSVGSSDVPYALALQGTKIVAVGSCHNGTNYDFCAIRLLSDGELDSSFGTDGTLLIVITGNSESATGVAVDSSGRLVISGHCSTSELMSEFCIVRLLDDGSPDPDFDGDSGTGDGKLTVAMSDYDDVAEDLVIQPDGSIVLTGHCDTDDSGETFNWEVCLVMLDEDGVVVTAFGSQGRVFTSMGTGARANTISYVPAAPESKLLIAGFCYDDSASLSCAARYITTMGDLDADGDGVPLPDDLCPNTGPGETVNADGCSANDLAPPDCSTINLTNVIEGTSASETIKGTSGNDLIIGNGGNDTITGLGGDDCIIGGDGNDTIDGGLGNDVIFGGGGNDNLKGGNGNDVIYGGEGNDTIDGGNDNDRLFGEGGTDTINGGNGDDYLDGGEGADTLNGGNGNDRLDGGDGTDKLNGGAGTDACTLLDPGGTRTLCEVFLQSVQ